MDETDITIAILKHRVCDLHFRVDDLVQQSRRGTTRESCVSEDIAGLVDAKILALATCWWRCPPLALGDIFCDVLYAGLACSLWSRVSVPACVMYRRRSAPLGLDELSTFLLDHCINTLRQIISNIRYNPTFKNVLLWKFHRNELISKARVFVSDSIYPVILRLRNICYHTKATIWDNNWWGKNFL